MTNKRIAKDIIKFLKTYNDAIILSDNETANIEHYLRAKGLMDLARYYHRTTKLSDDLFSEIEKTFKEIENLTILRVNNNINS
jgi:HD superfamily phosphohydrolase